MLLGSIGLVLERSSQALVSSIPRKLSRNLILCISQSMK